MYASYTRDGALIIKAPPCNIWYPAPPKTSATLSKIINLSKNNRHCMKLQFNKNYTHNLFFYDYLDFRCVAANQVIPNLANNKELHVSFYRFLYEPYKNVYGGYAKNINIYNTPEIYVHKQNIWLVSKNSPFFVKQ